MPNYAVVDLGSNSIRLVVYDVKDAHKRTCTNKDFKSLINDKVMAGLSAYVVDGVFTQDGIDRAVSVLRGHAKRARYFDCEKMEVFATAVIRNALNCEEAVAAIEEAAELPISLLSATDEAHLGFVGATCDRAVERGTLVDIGGGSTELTRIESSLDFDNASIGQGSLSSFAHYLFFHILNLDFRCLLCQKQRFHSVSCCIVFKKRDPLVLIRTDIFLLFYSTSSGSILLIWLSLLLLISYF